MSQTTVASAQNDDEIDIGQIIHTLWLGKWLIIFLTFIGGALGVAYALMATPIYSGNALLQVEVKSAGFAGLTGLSDAFAGGDGAATSTELEILKSRKVVVPTIEKFNLEIGAKPLTFPIIGAYFLRTYGGSADFATPPLAEYFDFMKDYAWGGEQIIVNQFNVPEGLYKTGFQLIILGDDNYSLNLDGKTVFKGKVGVQHHIDELNIDIQVGQLEGRIGTYFSLIRYDQVLVIDDLVKNITVVEKGKQSGIMTISMQGEDKIKIVKTIDHILATFQQQNIEYSSIEAERSLKFIEGQLPEANNDMIIAEREIYEYRLNNKTVNLNLKTQQLLSQLLKLEEGLNDLKLLEPELSRKFKKNHPLYIEFLRKKADLESKRNDIELQTSQIPTEQFETFKLQRNVELSQKIYLQTLNKFEELKIIKAGTIGSIRIIDQTIVHPRAVKPQKAIVAIIATLLGFILAVAIILLKAMLNKGVESIDQLEDLGYNVYASIPVSPTQDKLSKRKPKKGVLRLLSHSHPEELAVEALRSLRTSLHFAMMEADNNIIMLTGPSPGIGKSFISQNLAALIAQSDSKVLLVDIDFRRGLIHENFGLDAAPGFSDFLSGAKDFDEVCQKTEIKGLDVITRGKNPPNPSELLMSKSFNDFCDKYKDEYDFIILDTPPILAVTDAAIVGKLAGTSMMVVKQSVNHLKEIEQATNKLTVTGVEIRGYIFNGISKKSTANHYHYEYN
ncbi:MAG: polysaccharide biosynthesis tyrosine autokinase [Rhizobiales bacterium]|nr:polysaccharide biosynthesis tyrosine autokinase [Hyphomicrobiales bacterium]NRB15721.1 polysaccharide biosynthesis tyrosine autokinase [Hyphomicrobiales bacterium]